MRSWRNRSRAARSWSWRKPRLVFVSRRPARFRRKAAGRPSKWEINGIDIRLPLAILLPLAFLIGGTLAHEEASVLRSSDVVSGQIAGVASVIDGDTIEIHGQRIRLDGIDAPESAQLCRRGSVPERCGRAAAFFLSDMIGRQTVRCETHDVDRYGRNLATCWIGARNLNEAMVAAGQAVAYRRYSGAYIGAEETARARAVGVWATDFEMPWDYRR